MNLNFWGVDFGTTNSAMLGHLKDIHGSAYTLLEIRDSDGGPFSSVVAIDVDTNEVFVGYEAKNRYYTSPYQYKFISSIKTVLEDDSWQVQIRGKIWEAKDIAAEIFRQLKVSANKLTYHPSEIVVAVPNGASGKMKNKLNLAAQSVGLTIIQFITEPTAAFFANYNTLQNARRVVVFDWGGGTLDVTVLENQRDGTIVERAKKSLPLAGDKIDEAVALDIHRQVMETNTLNIPFRKMSLPAQGALLNECERAKRALNNPDASKSHIDKTLVQCMSYDGYVVRKELTLEHFQRITEVYVNQAMQILVSTIADAGLTEDKIDKVLVVGGSSNLKAIRARISGLFNNDNKRVLYPHDAEWNIAKGASRLSLCSGKSYSAEDIGIILGDEKGSFFPLLYGYYDANNRQALETYTSRDTPKKTSFGIMDTTEYPRIVFATRDEFGHIDVVDQALVARAYGFLTEQIVIETVVDKGQMFCARIQSNHTTKKDALYWEYPHMRIVYEAPSFGE